MAQAVLRSSFYSSFQVVLTHYRRRWKKFHIGVCPKTHEIIVAEVTELEAADGLVG